MFTALTVSPGSSPQAIVVPAGGPVLKNDQGKLRGVEHWQSVCVILPERPRPAVGGVPPRRKAHRRRSRASGAMGRRLRRARAAPCSRNKCRRIRRPRQAIGAARAWADGRLKMMQARAVGGHAMGAARPTAGGRPVRGLRRGSSRLRRPCTPSTTSGPPPARSRLFALPTRPALRQARIERDWQRGQLPGPDPGAACSEIKYAATTSAGRPSSTEGHRTRFTQHCTWPTALHAVAAERPSSGTACGDQLVSARSLDGMPLFTVSGSACDTN